MQRHIDSTTDVQPTPQVASLGGFATPFPVGNIHGHGNPPQAIPIPIQARLQQYQLPPFTLTTAHTSPGSSTVASEPSSQLPKQPTYPANMSIGILSANINLSPTSTAGSSGPPPSVGRTVMATTSLSKYPSEMEDEPRDFAELPKTSPHFNTHLLLPLPDAARRHAPTAGLGHEEHDAFHASKLSFAPVFAPVEIIPYGTDRVLFVEGLICEYAPFRFRSFTLPSSFF